MTKTFRDLGVDPALCDALAANGITHPFPIQELTLPLALEGHDLIGQARTGTGKTLAFGLPLLQRLDPKLKQTQALVIVPTRELCLQVYSDLEIGAAKGLTSISVYGGVGYDEQIDALTAGAHVVVGTPGRLLDLLNRGVLDLSKVTQLVLDEADEMLDMGFLPDVERLVEACQGADRHTMLFSATMPTAIVKLARRYMDHPTFTRADHEQKNTAPLVTQYFFEVHRMDKPRLLARILQSKDRGGVYVFVRTKHMADRLVNDLEELRIPSIAIHGDLRQSTREKNLDRFRSGEATVLVCTEVAARGLDVTGVTHVVNYDCPDDEKMYLHRIGRTARAGESGVAITFAEFNEIDRLNVIRKAVGAVDAEVQQIFSTSKQLHEMFELPDERPWDHLTSKAGADEARAKRESRTDGKPKSGRSPEGRGGDHDARRGGRGAKDRDGARGKGDRANAGSESAKTGNREKTTGREKTSGNREKTSGNREKASAGRNGPATSTPDAATSPGTDEAATAPPRNRERSGRGRRSTTSTSETTATSASTETPTAAPTAAPASSERDSGGRDRSSRDSAERGTAERGTTTRTRTRTRARSTSSDTASTSSSSRSRGRGNADATAAADADTAAASSEPTSKPSSSGRQRARGGASRNAKSRGGGTSSRGNATKGRTRSSSGSDAGSGSTDTPRGEGSRSKQGDGNRRGGSGRRSSGDTSSGRGNNARTGSRSGRSDAGDTTVTVADRGEDARGEGQPQVSRRVKVEHLP